jgi:hypothetical protein
MAGFEVSTEVSRHGTPWFLWISGGRPMPKRMTSDELETALKSAEEIDAFDFKNPDNENDFLSA